MTCGQGARNEEFAQVDLTWWKGSLVTMLTKGVRPIYPLSNLSLEGKNGVPVVMGFNFPVLADGWRLCVR